MKYLILILVVGLIGCQKAVTKEDPIVYGFMPDSMTAMRPLLDTIKQADSLSKYDDFKSIGINGGAGYTCEDDNCKLKTNVTLPAGILVSDRSYYEWTYGKKAIVDVNRRLVIAKELYNSYDKQVKVAEKLYDKRIQKLEADCERSWFEKNMIYFGFAGGIILTILVEYATLQVAK